MDGHEVAWRWFAHAAVGGCFVLLLGSLATRLGRQPVHKCQIIILTLVAGFTIPWLSLLPQAPRWSTGFVLPVSPVREPALAGSSKAGPEPAMIETGLAEPRQQLSVPSGVPRFREADETAGAAIGLRLPSWDVLMFSAFVMASAGWAAWWLLGQFLLWRIVRRARAVSPEVRDVFRAISGPAGHAVVLLESDRVRSPMTFTWTHPVIVLPVGLGDGLDIQKLRFCLAHEWSHIERQDALVWNLAALAGLVLCFQPLFWWLRRQLRLCQDYLADDRAAQIASAEDYAAYLVGLAQAHQAVSLLPALGVGDRRSNLYRRVAMLVQGHEPLEHRCRRIWSVAAALTAVVVVIAVSGLRLDAAPNPAEEPPQKPTAASAAKKPAEKGRTFICHVIDKETGKPVAGASVVVRIALFNDPKTGTQRILEETRQTTDKDGTYRVAITPERAADRSISLYLDVDHPGYVKEYGTYGYGRLLRNEKLGDRPFFETVKLEPGKAITGAVVGPDGMPLAGVKISAYCTRPKPASLKDASDLGRFTWTKTGADGRFHLDLYPAGPAVFWVLPRNYALETHVLGNDQRGDLGTITLAKGNTIEGKILDAQGKPAPGVYVSADRDRTKELEELKQIGFVADHIRRSVVSSSDGSFTIHALPAGQYRISVNEDGWDPATREDVMDNVRRPLRGVFDARRVTVKDGVPSEAVIIRGLPHVVVEAQTFDSKGKKAKGDQASLGGSIHGSYWGAYIHAEADGGYRWLAPKGLEAASIRLPNTGLRIRRSSRDKLANDSSFLLGSLDQDVKGIEIVRYASPVLVVKVAAEGGSMPADATVSVAYASMKSRRGGRLILKGGELSDCVLVEQQDGRFRSEHLLPDEEFTVTAKAKGHPPKTMTLMLAEGATKEIDLVLDRN